MLEDCGKRVYSLFSVTFQIFQVFSSSIYFYNWLCLINPKNSPPEMHREIISLHVGQCGNQLGTEFWRQLCTEHGIGLDGAPTSSEPIGDRKDTYFAQRDSGHFTPRAVLVDLEPRVIHAIQRGPLASLFSPESVYVHHTGSGAGNNWASGYEIAATASDSICEMVRREAENCENFAGISLMHSISGGTGSGVGSFLLETVRDDFSKKHIQAYSVFPNQGERHESDVIVQPYNGVLTMKRLISHVDACFVLDNTAITRIATEQLRLDSPSISQINSIIASALAASTATLRFPTGSAATLAGMLSQLIPLEPLHFLTLGCTPITIPGSHANILKTSAYEVLRRLMLPSQHLVSVPREGAYISMLNILQGDVTTADMFDGIRRMHPKLPPFAPWCQRDLQVVLAKQSPYAEQRHRVSGLLIANHTSTAGVFAKLCSQFDQLWKRGGFLDQYKRHVTFADDLEEFVQSREAVAGLLEAYKEAEAI